MMKWICSLLLFVAANNLLTAMDVVIPARDNLEIRIEEDVIFTETGAIHTTGSGGIENSSGSITYIGDIGNAGDMTHRPRVITFDNSPQMVRFDPDSNSYLDLRFNKNINDIASLIAISSSGMFANVKWLPTAAHIARIQKSTEANYNDIFNYNIKLDDITGTTSDSEFNLRFEGKGALVGLVELDSSMSSTPFTSTTRSVGISIGKENFDRINDKNGSSVSCVYTNIELAGYLELYQRIGAPNNLIGPQVSAAIGIISAYCTDSANAISNTTMTYIKQYISNSGYFSFSSSINNVGTSNTTGWSLIVGTSVANGATSSTTMTDIKQYVSNSGYVSFSSYLLSQQPKSNTAGWSLIVGTSSSDSDSSSILTDIEQYIFNSGYSFSSLFLDNAFSSAAGWSLIVGTSSSLNSSSNTTVDDIEQYVSNSGYSSFSFSSSSFFSSISEATANSTAGWNLIVGASVANGSTSSSILADIEQYVSNNGHSSSFSSSSFPSSLISEATANSTAGWNLIVGASVANGSASSSILTDIEQYVSNNGYSSSSSSLISEATANSTAGWNLIVGASVANGSASSSILTDIEQYVSNNGYSSSSLFSHGAKNNVAGWNLIVGASVANGSASSSILTDIEQYVNVTGEVITFASATNNQTFPFAINVVGHNMLASISSASESLNTESIANQTRSHIEYMNDVSATLYSSTNAKLQHSQSLVAGTVAIATRAADGDYNYLTTIIDSRGNDIIFYGKSTFVSLSNIASDAIYSCTSIAGGLGGYHNYDTSVSYVGGDHILFAAHGGFGTVDRTSTEVLLTLESSQEVPASSDSKQVKKTYAIGGDKREIGTNIAIGGKYSPTISQYGYGVSGVAYTQEQQTNVILVGGIKAAVSTDNMNTVGAGIENVKIDSNSTLTLYGKSNSIKNFEVLDGKLILGSTSNFDTFAKNTLPTVLAADGKPALRYHYYELQAEKQENGYITYKNVKIFDSTDIGKSLTVNNSMTNEFSKGTLFLKSGERLSIGTKGCLEIGGELNLIGGGTLAVESGAKVSGTLPIQDSIGCFEFDNFGDNLSLSTPAVQQLYVLSWTPSSLVVKNIFGVGGSSKINEILAGQLSFSGTNAGLQFSGSGSQFSSSTTNYTYAKNVSKVRFAKINDMTIANVDSRYKNLFGYSISTLTIPDTTTLELTEGTKLTIQSGNILNIKKPQGLSVDNDSMLILQSGSRVMGLPDVAVKTQGTFEFNNFGTLTYSMLTGDYPVLYGDRISTLTIPSGHTIKLNNKTILDAEANGFVLSSGSRIIFAHGAGFESSGNVTISPNSEIEISATDIHGLYPLSSMYKNFFGDMKSGYTISNKLKLSNGATLTILSGETLTLNRDANLLIKNGSKLQFNRGSRVSIPVDATAVNSSMQHTYKPLSTIDQSEGTVVFVGETLLPSSFITAKQANAKSIGQYAGVLNLADEQIKIQPTNQNEHTTPEAAIANGNYKMSATLHIKNAIELSNSELIVEDCGIFFYPEYYTGRTYAADTATSGTHNIKVLIGQRGRLELDNSGSIRINSGGSFVNEGVLLFNSCDSWFDAKNVWLNVSDAVDAEMEKTSPDKILRVKNDRMNARLRTGKGVYAFNNCEKLTTISSFQGIYPYLFETAPMSLTVRGKLWINTKTGFTLPTDTKLIFNGAGVGYDVNALTSIYPDATVVFNNVPNMKISMFSTGSENLHDVTDPNSTNLFTADERTNGYFHNLYEKSGDELKLGANTTLAGTSELEIFKNETLNINDKILKLSNKRYEQDPESSLVSGKLKIWAGASIVGSICGSIDPDNTGVLEFAGFGESDKLTPQGLSEKSTTGLGCLYKNDGKITIQNNIILSNNSIFEIGDGEVLFIDGPNASFQALDDYSGKTKNINVLRIKNQANIESTHGGKLHNKTGVFELYSTEGLRYRDFFDDGNSRLRNLQYTGLNKDEKGTLIKELNIFNTLMLGAETSLTIETDEALNIQDTGGLVLKDLSSLVMRGMFNLNNGTLTFAGGNVRELTLRTFTKTSDSTIRFDGVTDLTAGALVSATSQYANVYDTNIGIDNTLKLNNKTTLTVGDKEMLLIAQTGKIEADDSNITLNGILSGSLQGDNKETINCELINISNGGIISNNTTANIRMNSNGITIPQQVSSNGICTVISSTSPLSTKLTSMPISVDGWSISECNPQLKLINNNRHLVLTCGGQEAQEQVIDVDTIVKDQDALAAEGGINIRLSNGVKITVIGNEATFYADNQSQIIQDGDNKYEFNSVTEGLNVTGMTSSGKFQKIYTPETVVDNTLRLVNGSSLLVNGNEILKMSAKGKVEVVDSNLTILKDGTLSMDQTANIDLSDNANLTIEQGAKADSNITFNSISGNGKIVLDGKTASAQEKLTIQLLHDNKLYNIYNNATSNAADPSKLVLARDLNTNNTNMSIDGNKTIEVPRGKSFILDNTDLTVEKGGLLNITGDFKHKCCKIVIRGTLVVDKNNVDQVGAGEDCECFYDSKTGKVFDRNMKSINTRGYGESRQAVSQYINNDCFAIKSSNQTLSVVGDSISQKCLLNKKSGAYAFGIAGTDKQDDKSSVGCRTEYIGGVIGYDKAFDLSSGGHKMFGLALAYSKNDLSLYGNNINQSNKTDIDQKNYCAFGYYDSSKHLDNDGTINVNAMIGFNHARNVSDRIDNSSNMIGKFNNNAIFGKLDLVKYSKPRNGFKIGPWARFSTTYNVQESYAENGSNLVCTSDKLKVAEVDAIIGLSMSGSNHDIDHNGLDINCKIGYLFTKLLDRNHGGILYNSERYDAITGDDKNNSFVGQFGCFYKMSQNISVMIMYNAKLSKSSKAHALSFGLGMQF